jgi:hypothetical protein
MSGTWSGHAGVTRCGKTGRWVAQLWREGGNLYLGKYDTVPEAVAARRAALITYNAFRGNT